MPRREQKKILETTFQSPQVLKWNNMMSFEFSAAPTPKPKDHGVIFTGFTFYNIYKDAEFLRSSENVETILGKGHELRNSLKKVPPGQTIPIKNMCLVENRPLLVKNTSGPNVSVEAHEFTYNRLTGLAAAYAFENRHLFPTIYSSEAAALGLVWDNSDERACKLYLSAVSGTEHFLHQFSFYPLICALRKLQLKKITIEPVLKIAKIKNDKGERMATQLMKNYFTTCEIWKLFFGNAKEDLRKMLSTAPPQLKKVFVGKEI